MQTALLGFLLLCSFSVFGEPHLSVFDHSGQKYELSRDKLLSLPLTEITTAHPWSEGESIYEGVTLLAVVESMNLSVSSSVTFVALNNYKITIPKSDFYDYQPVIAIKQNGAFMSIRDKGPYWLIYPLSDRPDINNASFHTKMIWQLRDIYL